MRLLFLISFLFTSVFLNAQSFKKAKPYYILKYDVQEEVKGFSRAVIRSPFASDILSKKPLPRDFDDAKIVAIDYYYTKFKSAESFVQISLDEARFKNLHEQFPLIHSQIDSVPVRFIEQTLAQTIPEAKLYFHGFVVYYQTEPVSRAVRKSEINLINKLFKNGFELDDSPKFGEIRKISGTRPGDFLNVWGKNIHLAKPDTVIVVDGREVEEQIRKISNGSFVTCYQEGAFLEDNKIEVKLYRVPKEYFPGSSPAPFQAGMFGLMEKDYKDSRLRAMSLKKQEFPNELSNDLFKSLQSYNRDSIVVVIDITGSMVPPMAQVLKWMHQEEIAKKVKGIVLFNDGDGRRDKTKEIGETGGIYFIDRLGDLQKVLVRAMSKGNGGDLIENDLEALVKGRAHFGAGNYILVADNIAHPRDLPLLFDIKFPVNLLMCNGFEPKSYYLDIVQKTGGIIINRK